MHIIIRRQYNRFSALELYHTYRIRFRRLELLAYGDRVLATEANGMVTRKNQIELFQIQFLYK